MHAETQNRHKAQRRTKPEFQPRDIDINTSEAPCASRGTPPDNGTNNDPT